MKINKKRRKYKKNVSQKWNLVENGQKIKPSEKLKALSRRGEKNQRRSNIIRLIPVLPSELILS